MVDTLKSHSKILFGIPFHKPDDRFLECLPKLIEECNKEYTLQVISVPNRELVDSQNYISKYFLQETDYDYLLLMENDHWGHTKEMLDAMIKFDKEVVAMNYHSRHFPYPNCLLNRIAGRAGVDCYTGLTYTQGFHKCDIAGYAMMLLKRSVFAKLALPYFRLNKDGGDGSYATDIDFCLRLKEVGIDIWGCFDYCLSHRDITKENRMEKFFEGMKEYRENDIKSKLLNRRS